MFLFGLYCILSACLLTLVFTAVLFQGEGQSNDNFLVRVLKLILNTIAVLLLAGGISFLIKVHFGITVLIFVNNRIVKSDWSRIGSIDSAVQCSAL